jgi:ferredoxin
MIMVRIKKIEIDKNKCIGCGTCASLAPEVFELDKNNKSTVKNINGADVETIKLAADSCPTEAIKIEME